jgi:hypothetical protein
MQASANFYPPLDSRGAESDPPFNIVIVYEDFETGKQAKRTFDFLAEHLQGECQFTNQMWKFDVLNIPRLREMAAKDAAAADIVIISCHARNELAPEVKAWIELWLAEKNNTIALVALVGSPPGFTTQTMALRRYLAEVALRGGMEFFAQPEDAQAANSWAPLLMPQRSSQPINLPVASLARAVQREGVFPHWGINE